MRSAAVHGSVSVKRSDETAVISESKVLLKSRLRAHLALHELEEVRESDQTCRLPAPPPDAVWTPCIPQQLA
jgi:hypothetical protein